MDTVRPADDNDAAVEVAIEAREDMNEKNMDEELNSTGIIVNDQNADDVMRTPVPGTKRRSTHTICGGGGSQAKKISVRRRLFNDNDNDDDGDGDDDDDNGKQLIIHNQQRRENKEEILKKLRSKPEIDRFVCNNDIIDLRTPLPGFQGASTLLTSVYNTFVYIVKFKDTEQALQNRKLTIQLLTIEHYLRELERNKYADAHIELPGIVESLFSTLDYRIGVEYINQLKPISCVLDKQFIADKITYRSMQAESKNESNYIEFMFNNPFRFIFIGLVVKTGQFKRNTVDLFPFFGEYINKAISDMYDVLYDMVTKEIKKAKMELAEKEQQTGSRGGGGEGGGMEVNSEDAQAMTTIKQRLNNQQQNSLLTMESYSNNKARGNTSSSDRDLVSYLQCVTLPLAKRENIDIITTSGNSGKKGGEISKINYLVVEKDQGGAEHKRVLKMIDSDMTKDAVFLSSYIRCRVLIVDQPVFVMQIYTKYAIKLETSVKELVKFSDLDERS